MQFSGAVKYYWDAFRTGVSYNLKVAGDVPSHASASQDRSRTIGTLLTVAMMTVNIDSLYLELLHSHQFKRWAMGATSDAPAPVTLFHFLVSIEALQHRDYYPSSLDLSN